MHDLEERREGDQVKLIEFIPDHSIPDPRSMSFSGSNIHQVRKVVYTLPKKERDILCMLHGIPLYGVPFDEEEEGKARQYTREELAQLRRCTPEYIRQLEVKAIKALRHPSRARLLKPVLRD